MHSLESLFQKCIDSIFHYNFTDIQNFDISGMTKYDTLVLPTTLILLVSIVHHGRNWLEDDKEYSMYQIFKKSIGDISTEQSLETSNIQSDTSTEPLIERFKKAFETLEIKEKKLEKHQDKSFINSIFFKSAFILPIFIILLGIVSEYISINNTIFEYFIDSDAKSALIHRSIGAVLLFFIFYLLAPSLSINFLKQIYHAVSTVFKYIAPAVYSFIAFLLLQNILYYAVSYDPERSGDRLKYFKSLIFTSNAGLGNYEFLYREAITHSIAYSIFPLIFGKLDGIEILKFYALRRIFRILYDFVPFFLATVRPYIFFIIYAFITFITQNESKTDLAKPIYLKENTSKFGLLYFRVILLIFSISTSFGLSWVIGMLKLGRSPFYQNLESIWKYLYPYLLDDFCLAIAFYAVNFYAPLLLDLEKTLSLSAIETIADSFFLPFIYGSYKLSKYIKSEHQSLLKESVDERSPVTGYHDEHHLLRDANELSSYYYEKSFEPSGESPILAANGTYQLAFKHLQNGSFDFWLIDEVRFIMYSKTLYPILVSDSFLPLLMVTFGFCQLLIDGKSKKNNLDDVSKLDNLLLLNKGFDGTNVKEPLKIQSFIKGTEEFIKRNDPYHELHDIDIKQNIPDGVLSAMYRIFLPIIFIFASSLLIYVMSTVLTFSLHDKTINHALGWSFDQIFPIFYMLTYACSMPIANSFYHYRHSLDFGNKVSRFIVSLIPCFGYYFLRRFVRRAFDLFGWDRPWTNVHLIRNLAIAVIISAIYAFGGPLRLLPVSLRKHAAKFAYGIFALALLFVIKTAKSSSFEDIIIAIFNSVAYDIQYSLGYTILDLNSWLPDCLRHSSLTGISQSMNFGLFEIVAVFSEFKYENLFSPPAMH